MTLALVSTQSYDGTERVKATINKHAMGINKFLLSVRMTILALGLQVSGHAQGNLVNLYDWSNDTMYSGSPQNNIRILSFNAASFNGSQSTNGAPYPLALPVLTGSLAAGSGSTYEISFTMQNEFLESGGQTEMQFGGFTTNFDLPPAQLIGGNLRYFPVNIDFTASAVSLPTTMRFTVPVDTGDAILLNNFSVTEVPEISSAGLIGFGGSVLLLVQQLRRLFQKRKKTDCWPSSWMGRSKSKRAHCIRTFRSVLINFVL